MIRELHEKLTSGQTTSVKLTEEYFNVIEKNDSEIGAYLTLMKESALKQAETVDRKIKNGEPVDLLAGIPGAVKDVICTEGVRTTAGSKILDNYMAPYDATVVSRLKEAGAVILGKTNCDEFAMGSSNENSAYKIVKNPIDHSRVPGGSSGGSAAAVAADMAAWTLGTDTGGSIRQPSSFCGTVGLKPTYGRVSRHGLIAMASSFDQAGPITKTVEDAAIVLSRIAGQDPMDATSAHSGNKKYEGYLDRGIKNVRIGVPKEYFSDGLSDEVRELAEKAVEKFKNMGAIVESISLPNTEYSLPTYYMVVFSEVSSNLARFDGIKYGIRINDQAKSANAGNESGTILETYLDSRKYGLGAEVKRRIMLGTYALSAGYYDAYYLKAQKVRNLIRRDFEEVFKKVDFIFSPTAPEVAFKFGEKTDDPLKMYLSDIYTITANLSGVPAISFPIGTIEKEGKALPLGGQLMGKWFDEEGLLNAANEFEQNRF